jgi:response regulator of citrate/malate metabolism
MEKLLVIMLVDDSGIDLFLHEKLISLQPFTKSVLKFSSTSESINYLKNSAPEKWPDYILLDIQMPVEDGFAFLKQYEKLDAESRKKCGVIMVSSSLNIDDILRAKANPEVLGLLLKPLSVNELEKILKANQG